MALEKAPRRGSPRYPVNVAFDVIALRSGVPENLPGRCTDLSEGGVGGMVAGDLASGQQVAVELRLPMSVCRCGRALWFVIMAGFVAALSSWDSRSSSRS